ncbi:undecaprenyl-phosphate glucose phosphotransferase [Microbulbifer hainanensis]|uniref:undecaprenyl-phosphate glucose phosphotransferase n=1 Tax=Microbulbifer hainanensis TaxID=2735675 RepID=UPI0029C04066|nr:undecaprenyl-phosphate glucose phosphotransferase [Microbulbifer hainanensis]
MQRGWIRAYQSDLAAVYRAIDGLLIMGALVLSLEFWGLGFSRDWLIVGLLATAAFAVMAEPVELYRSWRTDNFRSMATTTGLACVSVFLLLLIIGYFGPWGDAYPRAAVGTWFALTLSALILWRFILRSLLAYMRVHDRNTRSAAIIGVTESGLQLANDLAANPQLGIRLRGCYRIPGTDSVAATDMAAAGLGRIGELQQAVQAARAGELDLVYIALPIEEAKRIGEILAAFSDTTATVHLLPDIFGSNLLHARWQRIGRSSVLSIYDTPIHGISGWMKRLEDVVLSSVGLLLLAPLMLLIAAGVKLSSPGPVFFHQRRYGYCGCTIDVWKFRSMTTQDDGEKIVQARRNDPRVTRFGSFLRRTSLDELPQLFNVLRGDMSIVGPRPHAVAHNEQYRSVVSGYMLRHKVKPGITGWAQINGWRGETDTLEKMHKRVQYDLDYIRNWSMFFDLYIVLMTVFKGFTSKNAY